MVNRSPRYKRKKNFKRELTEFLYRLNAFEDYKEFWKDRLKDPTEEDIELVSSVMAGLDYEAEISGMGRGKNYNRYPKVSPLAWLDAYDGYTLADRAGMLEVATLYWVSGTGKGALHLNEITELTDEHEILYDVKKFARTLYLLQYSDLKTFWEGKGLSKSLLIMNFREGKRLVEPDQLKQWLRYDGGEPLPESYQKAIEEEYINLSDAEIIVRIDFVDSDEDTENEEGHS